RQDRIAGGGDGEGQYAFGSEPGSKQDRRSFRGLRAEDCSQDRRAEIHPNAWGETVDGFTRPSLYAGGRPGDRARFWTQAGLYARRRLDSCRLDVSGDAGSAFRVVWCRTTGRECARAEREARRRELPQWDHRVGVSL